MSFAWSLQRFLVSQQACGNISFRLESPLHSNATRSKAKVRKGVIHNRHTPFFCALTFYYFVVLRIDYHKTRLLDLGWSDSAQYFATAKAMARDGYPYLDFGHEKLPTTYPIGYPALMMPWLKILPEAESILAPYRTNQTIGLLLLLTAFGFYSYLGMPLTGGFAALFLTTFPGFFTLSRSSTSEVSASAFVRDL
jgi:hypothetical protein